MISLILSGIEALVNKLIPLDADLPKQLASLNSKIVAIEIIGLNVCCYIQPSAAGISLRTTTEQPATVTVTGSPLALLRLLTTEQPQALLAQQQVQIAGDLETLQHFKRIMTSIDIDWEEYLSRIVGDVAAHQLGNLLRGFTRWGKQTSANLRQNLSEYLQEEIRYFPPREELQDFMQEVDTLRNDAERLELRYQRLVTQRVTKDELA